MNAPVLSKSPSLDETTQYVRAVTRWVGPGFHPDTDMNDYVLPDGSRSFAKAQSALLNEDLDRARKVLEQASIDICEVGFPVQRKMLRFLGNAK